jgi:hypothetical protein
LTAEGSTLHYVSNPSGVAVLNATWVPVRLVLEDAPIIECAVEGVALPAFVHPSRWFCGRKPVIVLLEQCLLKTTVWAVVVRHALSHLQSYSIRFML